ncbi:MAG: aldo/keto reductase [Clostridium sp.]|nr:aldo/keto reductase [Clostridium sp.]
MMAELCLGTAQMGMQYGINNKIGKPQKQDVFEILDLAIENGIKMIDTASAYGEAEEILGEYLQENADRAREIQIISKQNATLGQMNSMEAEQIIRNELEQSLCRLKREYLDGYLMHSYRAIDRIETLEIFQKIKEDGLVKKIGVSVYEIDEAEIAIESGMVDYLQMPCSIFDQRGLTDGVFLRAKEQGVVVFARSAFLQGLLMMEESEIPEYLQDIVPYIRKLNELLVEYHIEKKHAIIKFILSESLIDYMVFGVDSKEQLQDILKEKDKADLPKEFIGEIKKEFSNISSRLVLPIHWGREK